MRSVEQVFFALFFRIILNHRGASRENTQSDFWTEDKLHRNKDNDNKQRDGIS